MDKTLEQILNYLTTVEKQTEVKITKNELQIIIE